MSKGRITRENILAQAFALASEGGLESLTIGELAKHCGMSKSGLFAHFNSKDNLQVGVIEYAQQVFAEKVIVPARGASSPDQESKIRLLLTRWLSWNHSFQGSCMFLDAWKDAATNQCPIQQALRKAISVWVDYLQIQIAKGVELGEFDQHLSPRQAVFELYGLYLSANLFYTIHGEQMSAEHFWQGVDKLLVSWKAA
ncbi:TetR/AcrR family transcriptional regulator [Vibrio sp. TRT 17S01]|uniref:TetR/AcrR family transcriptional regulator n=1 Tax=Vibrio sp. TRT 17S01 TaxID=3418505 RepID=UPI003CF4F3BF